MLRIFLLVNSASCAIFGGIFVVFPLATQAFIGTPPMAFITFLGVLLVLNAGLLALTAWRWYDLPKLVGFFVMGDILWVLMTAICLAFGIWIEGTPAIVASILVAIGVSGLGFGQYCFGLRPFLLRI